MVSARLCGSLMALCKYCEISHREAYNATLQRSLSFWENPGSPDTGPETCERPRERLAPEEGRVRAERSRVSGPGKACFVQKRVACRAVVFTWSGVRAERLSSSLL